MDQRRVSIMLYYGTSKNRGNSLGSCLSTFLSHAWLVRRLFIATHFLAARLVYYFQAVCGILLLRQRDFTGRLHRHIVHWGFKV